MTFRIVPDDSETLSLEDFRGQAPQRWREAREHLLEANLVAAQLLTIMSSRAVDTDEVLKHLDVRPGFHDRLPVCCIGAAQYKRRTTHEALDETDCGLPVGALVAASPLATSAARADIYNTTYGSWGSFKGIGSNWSCTSTKTASAAGTSWYAQECLIASGDYHQVALILRRSTAPGPSYVVLGHTGLELGTWQNSDLWTSVCDSNTVFYPGTVKVCMGHTHNNGGPVYKAYSDARFRDMYASPFVSF